MGRILLPLLAAFLSVGLVLGTAHGRQSPAYIALGDSLAFGVGAADPASGGYVGRAHDALRRSDRYRERGLELINLSVPGATSVDLLLPGGQLESALEEISGRQKDTSVLDDNVEIISIDIGGNDLLALGRLGSPCVSDPLGDECRLRFVQTLEELEENLTSVVESLREELPKADIIIVGLYNPYSGTGSPLEGAVEIGVRQLNRVLSDVAAQAGLRAKMADVADLFAGRGGQWISGDGLHPNDRGHTVIAEALLAAVQDRQPVIPQDLLTASPAATTGPPEEGADASLASTGGSDGGGGLLLLLVIAVPAAVLGGAIVGGAYLLARGRP